MKVPLIYFCLQRLGVLKKLTELLVAIDFGGHSIIRFIIVLDTMDKNGIDKLLPFASSPEQGTGQGNIHSPLKWLSVFYFLLM